MAEEKRIDELKYGDRVAGWGAVRSVLPANPLRYVVTEDGQGQLTTHAAASWECVKLDEDEARTEPSEWERLYMKVSADRDHLRQLLSQVQSVLNGEK